MTNDHKNSLQKVPQTKQIKEKKKKRKKNHSTAVSQKKNQITHVKQKKSVHIPCTLEHETEFLNLNPKALI